MFIATHMLDDLMNIIRNENKNSLMVGYFNIDLLMYKSHYKINIYNDNLFSNGLLPLITKRTRITSSATTLIDHIHITGIKYDHCNNYHISG